MKLDYVIELVVDEDALVDRITGRFSCAVCGEGYHDRYKRPTVEGTCDVYGSHQFKRSPDDNEETVRNRLAEYCPKTAQMRPPYEARGLHLRVDVMSTTGDVTTDIEQLRLT